MNWNWEKPEWPEFQFDYTRIKNLEEEFLYNSGILTGILGHFPRQERDEVVADIISNEAVKTSAIEGEIINRESVRSSLLKHFGFNPPEKKLRPAEQGISDLMKELYENFQTPLDHSLLYIWHRHLMTGRINIDKIGAYRVHEEPMQVLSGPVDRPVIHFEAPPSKAVFEEMEGFITWFNTTAPGGPAPLSILTRAGISHLYFVSIHPFEDGNGRIARALAEKSIAQYLNQPAIISLSLVIENNKKDYYNALAQNSTSLEITPWLNYFAKTLIMAQQESVKLIQFVLKKTKFFHRYGDLINSRQTKVLIKIFDSGPGGFSGGLSAENYIAISKTSRATATRDLQDLVQKKALTRTGELKATRYWLNTDTQ